MRELLSQKKKSASIVAFLAAFASQQAQAAGLAREKFGTETILFDSSTDTSGVGAKQIQWKLQDRSVYDLDSGETYMELIHTLKMPITSLDNITFEIQFTSASDTTTGTLQKDVYQCNIQNDTKQKQFWTTKLTDLNVRSAVKTNDINSGELLLGQDWEIEFQDINRESWDHLCVQSSAETGDPYGCSQIRCIGRRRIAPTDSNDVTFAPTAGTADTMNIAAGDASIIIGQTAVQTANKRYLVSLAAKTLQIVEFAHTLSSSVASLAALTLALAYF